MSRFSSDRERRLWLWTAVVLLGIYASMGWAGSAAAMLRDRGILETVFWIGLGLLALAIVAVGLRRPNAREIGVALGVAAVYVLVLARMGSPEERSHLIEYGIVALFAFEALLERKKNGLGRWPPWLIAIALTIIAGTFDEIVQAVLPERVFDWRDIGFDSLAALMAVAGSAALKWARNKGAAWFS